MTNYSAIMAEKQPPIDLSKVPFTLDEALVKRAGLEEDVVVIATALWRQVGKGKQISGWERTGLLRGVSKLGDL